MSNPHKIIVAARGFSGVNKFALGQKNYLVKERNDIASRLMDGEDDRAVIISCEGNQALDDTQGIVCIESWKQMSKML